MNPSKISKRFLSVVAAASVLALGCTGGPVNAVEPSGRATSGVQLDYLDRGLVAASTSEGVFLSWRLLGHEASGASTTGLTGTDFAVYRDDQKIATITDSTNFLDPAGTATSKYSVAAVSAGHEVDRSEDITSWASNFKDLLFRRVWPFS